MRWQDLCERCQALTGDDAEIALALETLETATQEWIQGIGQLQSLGLSRDCLQVTEPVVSVEQTPEAPAPPCDPEPEPRRVASASSLVLRPEKPPEAAPVVDAPFGEANDEDALPQSEVNEEALLAELDPEVANAVRIRRRLLGPKADIRKLIAEAQSGLGKKDASKRGSQKRTWWR